MKIIPNVYQITIGSCNSVNVFLVAEEKLTLIDTGSQTSAKQIIDFIHKIGRSEEEIVLIVITHNHPDHTGGLAKLKEISGAEIVAHQADIASLPFGRIVNKICQGIVRTSIGHHIYLDKAIIDRPLSGGEVLPPLGGMKVIWTPGHTPGSISLLAPKYRMLFVGDLINTRFGKLRIPYRLINVNTNDAKDSMKRVAELDFNIVCVGHGKPLMKDGASKVQRLVEGLV